MPEGEVRTISFNELRAMLQEGVDELMAAIPEGNDPVIKLSCFYGEQELPIKPEEMRPGVLLRDFSSAVETFRRIKKSTDAAIREFLGPKGVAQQIIREEEAWYQIYIQ